MNICFSATFYWKTFLTRKQSNGWLSHSSHPTGSDICHHVLWVNVWLQCRILDFANGTTLRQLLALLQYLESVTGKILLQRTENMKFIWCQVRAVKLMFETLPSTLLQPGCHLSGRVRCWHQVTLIFFDLWRSILVVTDYNLIGKFKKLSFSGSVCHAQNSVLKAFI